MSVAGRLELSEVLKRFADARGDIATQLIEQLQPVVVVGDLPSELPYQISIPWHAQFTKSAQAAVFSALEILLGDTTRPHWIEIEGIQNLGATADMAMRITVGAAGDITANQSSVSAAPRRVRGLADFGGLGLMTMRVGTSPAALSGPHYRLVQGDVLRVPFAVGGVVTSSADFAVFTVGHPTANTALDVAIWGKLHITTAK